MILEDFLSAKARLQINMNVPRIPGFPDLAKVNTTLIPILWSEEGINKLSPEIISTLKLVVEEPPKWHQAILYVGSIR